jgi:hypothetical protein
MRGLLQVIGGIVVVLVVIGVIAGHKSSDPLTYTPPTSAASPSSSDSSDASGLSASQKNAIEAAKEYLSTSAFSRTGLIQQLSSSAGSGYPEADAVFAVDSLNVDWDAEAAKAAKEYLSTMAFSRADLIQQLESSAGSGFTHAQAVYGVNQNGL